MNQNGAANNKIQEVIESAFISALEKLKSSDSIHVSGFIRTGRP
jgi:hypothetical protein